MDGLIEYICREGKIVKGAPFVFTATLILSFLGAFGVADWYYSGRIDMLHDTISNYKVQLEGATPEQAAKQINLLQRKIKDFEDGNVAMHCLLPQVPSAVMKPLEINMLDKMGKILSAGQTIDAKVIIDYAHDADLCRINLRTCQDMITAIYEAEGINETKYNA